MAVGVAWELLRAATNVGGAGLDSLTNNWVYMAVELVAIGVCSARVASSGRDRLAWGLMTFALACWSLGDLLWAVWLDNVAKPPYPSAADVAYLFIYPAMYASLMLQMRTRLRNAATSQWLDGGVVALAVGAVAAALVFSNILASTSGRFVAELVTVAYPVGDFILLMFVAAGCTLTGWRPGRDWLALGGGVILMAVADIADVSQVAGGVYVSGTLLNATYLAAFSMLALAAWMPSQQAARSHREAPHTIVMTGVAAAIALGVLVLAAFTSVTPLAVGLAAVALVVATIRSALTYLENVRILRATSVEAVTDALTGLANRRQLISDLEDLLRDGRSGGIGDQAVSADLRRRDDRAVSADVRRRDDRAVSGNRTATLVFFDLNGFKRYNDSFGHLAGDALLTRLGHALASIVESRGRAYRLGGDEFCILVDGRLERHDRLLASATAALTEHGHGFEVTTAMGLTVIPDEARTPSEALRQADERMYANKGRSNRVPSRDVLMQLLSECEPGLLDHSSQVMALTAGVGALMHLDAEQLDETLRAGELHDIGKLAIPDEILNKPGPLDDAEWEFMKQHPILGQRILNASPALAPVATLVRASHERWDGGGYPDGLAGGEIPLGARIIAACDAYDAMISERCYQSARSSQDALAELKRNADVVEAIERYFFVQSASTGTAGVHRNVELVERQHRGGHRMDCVPGGLEAVEHDAQCATPGIGGDAAGDVGDRADRELHDADVRR
jgi:diguanylate cyclase (GGDEF)-like protein